MILEVRVKLKLLNYFVEKIFSRNIEEQINQSMKTITLPLLLISFFTILSCKKDYQEPTPPVIKTNFIIDGAVNIELAKSYQIANNVNQYDSTWVRVKNIGFVQIDSATILVEYFNDDKKNHENIQFRHKVIFSETINVNNYSFRQELDMKTFSGFDENKIRATVLYTDNIINSEISGLYEGVYKLLNNDTIEVETGVFKGNIDFRGEMNGWNFSSNDLHNLNIQLMNADSHIGKLSNKEGTSFSNVMKSDEEIQSYTTTSDSLYFGLIIPNDAEENVKYLQYKLRKL